VNVLVLDTEVYSNTGGQASKATPLGAVAKFASAGKTVNKKDLGLIASMYGHVYVARVAMGAKMPQVVQALVEAEAYPGPSLVIAYSHCIAHGYDMAHGMAQQKLAVSSGVWPLYRFDPRRVENGEPPLKLDYGAPTTRVGDYMRNEARFRVVERTDPDRYRRFVKESQEAAERRYAVYQQLAGITVPQVDAGEEADAPAAPAENEE
jgi:pyruvate-ferredoxin/flavodoxin oxidoreductase